MTTITVVQSDDFQFIEGAKVHYGNSDTWLALCGSGWLNASENPAEVTCIECLNLLEQRENSNEGKTT